MLQNKLNFDKLSEKYIPIVLCAGFGTRLKPITDHIPKVICPIIDKPLAFFSIEKFFQAGFETVYCNTHYLPELVERELNACVKEFGCSPNNIVFFNEKEILGSGGGVVNIVQNLREQNENNKHKDVIVVSGDVVADIPLHEMLETWENRNKTDVALMLTLPLTEDREDLIYISEDENHVVGFGKKSLSALQHSNVIPRLFSNHQIIAAELFQNSTIKNESIVLTIYQKILNQSDKDKKIIHKKYPDSSFWFNVGDINEYKKCLNFFIKHRNLPINTKIKMHLNDSTLENTIKNFLIDL